MEEENKIVKTERELVKLYEEENEQLKDELMDLLKETEEKAFKLREQIAENRRYINAVKLKWKAQGIEEEELV